MAVFVTVVLVLVMQTRSLYTFPQPDGTRWWGDETGQMLELRSELQTGYAHIPTALGSSLAITNGLVRGNSWLAAIEYGLPALAFSKYFDLVTIGRTVTFLLSLAMCFCTYRLLRKLGVSVALALLGVLLLISTRSFFFASHAARLDVAAGLSVLLFVWYLATHFEQFKQAKWQATTSWYVASGAIAMLFATLSIHLVTLLGVLSFYTFWRFRAWRIPKDLFAAVGGASVVLGILIGIYFLTGAPMSLFSPSVQPNQFQSVASMLPILRPFSRSVQIANVLERATGIWFEAPQIVLLACIVLALLIVRRRMTTNTPATSFTTDAGIVILIAWLFFESPALYYYVQVLPLFVVVLLSKIASRIRPSAGFSAVILGCAVLLAVFSVKDSSMAHEQASRIETDNHMALDAAVRTIAFDSKNTRPIVLAQNPAIAYLEHDTSVRLMTAHLVSFPTSLGSLASQIESTGARYMLLYVSGDGTRYSEDYAALRPQADSIGTIMFKRTGTLFDVHRNYFEAVHLSVKPDTMILYKLQRAR